jgi:hypothetical protein
MRDDFDSEDASEDYEVGYGKPPKNSQFKKGFSGNPFGRPKKTPNLELELIRQLKTKVTLTDKKGKRRAVTKFEILAKQLVNRAASGSFRETRLLIALLPNAIEKAEKLNQGVGAKDLTDDQLAAIICADDPAIAAREAQLGIRTTVGARARKK